MDQNQTANTQDINNQTINNANMDNELQKAIDDITNTTNVDPVFSDPVAAPSSVPEGDTGELGEPIGPFPEPKVEPIAPAPAPSIPFSPVNAPELNTPAPAPAISSEPTLPPMPNLTAEPASTPESLATFQPTVAPAPASELAPEPASEPTSEPTPEPKTESTPTPEPTPKPIMEKPQSIETSNVHQIKEAALRDLAPLLSQLDIAPNQKFNLYRDIFEDLKDYTVLDSAYHTASDIPDEKERAEALLYLIESIDKM
ncbi:hypothetical protein IKG05_00830 [Candidatus Saccharibacteria bacterium]|nr:hypothetical protein [Candidatus Saccharibacteria bacterium]